MARTDLINSGLKAKALSMKVVKPPNYFPLLSREIPQKAACPGVPLAIPSTMKDRLQLRMETHA